MKYAYLFCILFCSGCSTSKYSSTNKIYKQQARNFAKELSKRPALIDSANMAADWAGTTNFGMRKPNFVIIHHTAQNSCDTTYRTFTLKRTEVSAHYVICRDGVIQHMLNDYLRAWHAGAGKWGNLTDVNSSSIGIELDNNGFEPFSDAQINSLLTVLKYLKKQFNIPTANFIGHADIAPKRKVDPSKYFPWKKLSENGFGYWYDTTGVKLPENFDAMQGLRIIGYDIADPASAIRAFRIHFEQIDANSALTNEEKKIVYKLMMKYE